MAGNLIRKVLWVSKWVSFRRKKRRECPIAIYTSRFTIPTPRSRVFMYGTCFYLVQCSLRQNRSISPSLTKAEYPTLISRCDSYFPIQCLYVPQVTTPHIPIMGLLPIIFDHVNQMVEMGREEGFIAVTAMSTKTNGNSVVL